MTGIVAGSRSLSPVIGPPLIERSSNGCSTFAEGFDELVRFAELEQFIDIPTKYYSAGMLARLGFAVSMAVEAEIMIIDEVLGVGDAAFQRKCEARMRAMMADGRTIVIVSHDAHAVRSLCDTAIWLDRGHVRASGPANEVVDAYEASSLG